MGEKRKRGRPRLPADQRGVPAGAFLRPALYDALATRARLDDCTVAAVIRKDLELVDAWRRRKRDGQ